jgi:aspartate kinase
MSETKAMEKVVISGVTYNKNEVKVTVRGVPDKPGIAAGLFSKLGAAGVNVDMIIQNVGAQGFSDISFTLDHSELKKAQKVMQEVAKTMGASGVLVDEGVAKVSVVGVGMRSHSGVAAKMFQSLADNGINIEMISTSEIKISVVIDEKDVTKAVNAIHKKFNLGKAKA